MPPADGAALHGQDAVVACAATGDGEMPFVLAVQASIPADTPGLVARLLEPQAPSHT